MCISFILELVLLSGSLPQRHTRVESKARKIKTKKGIEPFVQVMKPLLLIKL